MKMNMKKKVLSAAVLCAMGVGSAQAVNLSTTGTGEVLISPYYTVRDGNKTLLSIVNTTAEYKAIKVRFREGYNSREVLDFNLYMSPYDVWTAAVVDNGAGAAVLTNDTSCTVPKVTSTGIPFRSYAFDGSMTTSPVDGGPVDMDRVKEGYFEIIEMGIAGPIAANTGNPWESGDIDTTVDANHRNGVPNNCPAIVSNWTPNGKWTNNPASGMLPPTGGLGGSAAVINVNAGTEASIPLTVLEAYSVVLQHYAPGDEKPTLNEADIHSVVMTNTGVDDKAVVYYDTWTTGVDAVSAVLQTMSVANEYTLNPAVNGETSWVVTFPTKRWYVDDTKQWGDAGQALTVSNSNFGPDVARDPFTAEFQYQHSGELAGQACEEVVVSKWNREEYQTSGDVDFSPMPGAADALCYEVNVINFNNNMLAEGSVSSMVLGDSPLGHAINLDDANLRSGWARIGFAGTNAHFMGGVNGVNESPNSSATFYQGLPAIGFRASTVSNGNLVVDGSATLSNYAVSEPHMYERSVTPTTAVGLNVTPMAPNGWDEAVTSGI